MMLVVVVIMVLFIRMRECWRMILRVMCGSTFVKRRLAGGYDVGGRRWVEFALHKILNDFRCCLVVFVALLRWCGGRRLTSVSI